MSGTSSHHSDRTVDVLIIGSGPIGATVASQVREASPESEILMVEAGADLGGERGVHLTDSSDPHLLSIYTHFMRHALQLNYVQDGVEEFGLVRRKTLTVPSGGVLPAARLGFDTTQMPGASIAWNTGGMGIHWTAAGPAPSVMEQVPGLDGDDWDADWATAASLFQLTSDAFSFNPMAPAILDALRRVVPSDDEARAAQNMPMAGRRHSSGRFHRTGPADIFPPLRGGSDSTFRLVSNTLCTGLTVEAGRVSGASFQDVQTDERWTACAQIVVVAADTLRTPQLLWASGIRPRALGHYLNEHASVSGDSFVDPERLGATGVDRPVSPPEYEPFVGAYWIPSRGPAQPFHGQLMETANEDHGHVLGYTFYVPTEVRYENAIQFDDDSTDLIGLPRPTIRFSYTNRDDAMIDEARGLLGQVRDAIGPLQEGSWMTLAAGGSLHYTGTVRMGPADDGTSVCDLRGRVWDYENLYVAGNGVVPTALSCNSTLTSATLAVRSAREISRQLA
jgi:choline dehydrogenase-like flavoprotein